MALSFQRRFGLLLFAFVSVVLLLSVVYAQTTQPDSRPATGCRPNGSGDDMCSIYSISRENVEKHWPGCSAVTPSSCPVIPAGASGLPAGINPGQRIDADAIVSAIILRLQAQNLPTNPPKDWTTVLAAKKSVMSGIMNSLGGGVRYKGPTMIDFKGKKPVRTGGGEGGTDSRPATDSRPVTEMVSLVFARFFNFLELPIYSVSATTIPPVTVPVVITVLFSNPDGTTYRHSMFCWATGIDWATGNGHYLCHDHKNQGYYTHILDSKDEKVTGKRIPPYPGPGQPFEDTINVVGTLEIVISHDVH